jgi:anti-sigma regulatory factor (Ser/Thr protein kinase)
MTMPEDQNYNIEIEKLKEALEAEVFVGEELLNTTVTGIYASDLMSDVLAYGKPGACLLTGLNSIQTAISSHMADIKAIVFLRGKKPLEDICEFAKLEKIVILSTRADMYEACIKIAGINGHLFPTGKPLIPAENYNNLTSHEFSIEGSDFASAGLASTRTKTILKEIGYDIQLIRRIAISIYEGEMNVVMHALRAKVTLVASDIEIIIVIDDEGKGIPDIDEAMQPGFSTATEEQRTMGFGAGMGLPNIDKNTDDLKVTSEVGKGTRLEMKFFVKK